MTGKLSLRLLLILLWIPCGSFSQGIFLDRSDPLKPILSVEITAADSNIVRTLVNENNVSKVFALYLIKNNKRLSVPVTGKYALNGKVLKYVPLSELGAGLEFEGEYTANGDTSFVHYLTPVAAEIDVPLPELEQIFPRSVDIPCNQLYFHIRFSQPMFPNKMAWQVVKIYDEDQEEIPKMWRERSYWLDSNRVLVLMIHPGRVKRGIGLDVPFKEEQEYVFLIDGELSDAFGRCVKMYSKTKFFASKDDYEIPKVNHKEVLVPARGTEDPLSIQFSEAMDYASIIDGVTITDEQGKLVKGNFWPLDNDATIEFFPGQEWIPGTYTITYGKIVADLAGNRLNRPFEMTSAEEVLKDEPIVFHFQIK